MNDNAFSVTRKKSLPFLQSMCGGYCIHGSIGLFLGNDWSKDGALGPTY